jgi:hypothetical protein
MKTDLRLTDTNAASDSKGRTWGLEGGLFWWLVGGIGAGITVFFVARPLKSSFLTSFVVALLPVAPVSLTSSVSGRGSRPDTTVIVRALALRSGFAPSPNNRSFRHPLGGTIMNPAEANSRDQRQALLHASAAEAALRANPDSTALSTARAHCSGRSRTSRGRCCRAGVGRA